MAAIDPADYAAKYPKEHGQQVALFMWAAIAIHDGTYPELAGMFAIPNGGERNKVVAARLKAEGVKPGVPDVFLPVRRGGFAGLFIELKRAKTDTQAKGRASDKQNDFAVLLQHNGYGVAVCFGFEQARETIIAYLSQAA